jgi:RNA polymerase sigma factor for flagellar operon FliA
MHFLIPSRDLPEQFTGGLETRSNEMPIASVCEEVQAQPQPKVQPKAKGKVSKEDRDAIVLEHLSLVRAIAIRVYETLPVHIDLDDLIHAGVLGLFDAAEKFDVGQAVAFKSYAKHRIKGAILDSLRQMDWASRDLRKRHKQLEKVTRELAAVTSTEPSEADIAEKMGVGVERWRQMAVELRMVGLISASSRPGDTEDSSLPEFPAKPDLRPDRLCERWELGEALGQAIQTLPGRYQRVVTLYYTREMTMKEIGGILGINESRVSQIHKNALEKMATALRAAGIHSPSHLV